MTKNRIVVLLILDVILIAGAGYMAYTRFLQLQGPGRPASVKKARIFRAPAAKPKATPSPAKKSWVKQPEAAPAAEAETPAPPVPEIPVPAAPAEPVPAPVSPPAETPAPAPVPAVEPKKEPAPKKAAAPVKTVAPKAAPSAKTPPPKKVPAVLQANSKLRRTFFYFNSQARTVHLVGDFNGWTPVAFQREASGQWTASVVLGPGNYSYNFVVDGKTILDPAQKRTDSQGRSLLSVSAAPGN
jgi:outer membrane biosynthesis protein TonB